VHVSVGGEEVVSQLLVSTFIVFLENTEVTLRSYIEYKNTS